MKKQVSKKIIFLISAMLLSGCASSTAVTPDTSGPQTAEATEQTTVSAVASESDKVQREAVGYEGMQPVDAAQLKDGSYDIRVDSSSSMFKITGCRLNVGGGRLTAVMTMSGTGYEYLYMGTPEQAAAAPESEYISYKEENGVHSFEVPIEALDKEICCAAFSKKKQLWYDRVLVFRADSLPLSAFCDIATPESLGLADGEYSAEVTLAGGTGKASVQSPARLKIQDGRAVAEIVWSSNKYDYMVVDGEKYLPVSTDGASVFEIPVAAFDRRLPVLADTTAMSKPYEIEYTLMFDSATVK